MNSRMGKRVNLKGTVMAAVLIVMAAGGRVFAEDQPAATTSDQSKGTEPKAQTPAEPPKESVSKATDDPAPDAPVAQPAPAADPKQPPEWHRARMRLSGSMCMSCLKALQDEFKKLPGVQAIQLRRQSANSFELYSPELSVWADCIIVYDQKRAPLAGLRSVMKQEGYYPYQVNDKQLDHSPSEADAKF